MKRYSLLLIAPAFVVTGCSSVKSTLGMERAAPDEFAVVERAPLTMPPNFDLAPPQPGTARPQDQVTPAARGLVLGSQSSAPLADSGSRAEQALLSKAGAGTADSDIRQELNNAPPEEDKRTTAEKLGIVKSNRGPGKALDPMKEAKRLDEIRVKTTPIQEDPAEKKDADKKPATNAKK